MRISSKNWMVHISQDTDHGVESHSMLMVSPVSEEAKRVSLDRGVDKVEICIKALSAALISSIRIEKDIAEGLRKDAVRNEVDCRIAMDMFDSAVDEIIKASMLATKGYYLTKNADGKR